MKIFKKTKKEIPIKSKIILVFFIYLIVILLYGLTYSIIYYFDSSAYSFNSDIKIKNYQNRLKDIKEEIRSDFINGSRGMETDTVKEKDRIIITVHSFQQIYIIGNDTISVIDSTHIPQKAEELLKSYDRNKVYPLWSDLDFLYFSVITISTVGYGDILPNSTLVRMIVVSEVIIGQFIIIFFLSIVITGISKTIKGKQKSGGRKIFRRKINSSSRQHL